MIRTCNGLELRDQIPPLPPTIALANFDPTLLLDHHILEHALAASAERNMESISISKCKLHGNSKPSSTTVSPHHRVQSIDLMNDIPLQFPLDSNSPLGKPSTPIFEHKSSTSSTIIGPLSSSCTTTTLATSTPNRRQFQSNIDSFDSGGGGGGAGGGGGSSSNNILNDSKNVIKCSASASGGGGGGADVGCSGDQKLVNISNGLKHRWHACPELHKAMDGVTYIADHTKKEEESTRVSNTCYYFH